jgi:pyruvate,water dikinase
MKRKLRILGYLAIHTRQLDVIMHNDAFCEQLKAKMLADISSRVLSTPSGSAALV